MSGMCDIIKRDSLCALHFVLCSRDPDVLRAQSSWTFFLITHKSTSLENPIT